jgi:hypothetical protein
MSARPNRANVSSAFVAGRVGVDLSRHPQRIR